MNEIEDKCPRCGKTLEYIHCSVQCPHCKYKEGCCEGVMSTVTFDEWIAPLLDTPEERLAGELDSVEESSDRNAPTRKTELMEEKENDDDS